MLHRPPPPTVRSTLRSDSCEGRYIAGIRLRAGNDFWQMLLAGEELFGGLLPLGGGGGDGGGEFGELAGEVGGGAAGEMGDGVLETLGNVSLATFEVGDF